MKLAGLVAVIAAGCGTAAPEKPFATIETQTVPAPAMRPTRPGVAPAATEAAIRAALGAQASVNDGGVWFADPVCRARFAKPRTVAQVELDGFAKCLAALAWEPTARTSGHDDTAVVAYAPGFELELHVAGGKLDFVGFSGRGKSVSDAPMITPAALEALRTAGDPGAATATMVRICVGADGTSSVAPAAMMLDGSEPAVLGAIAAWKFRPFVVGEQPIAVCSVLGDRIPIPPGLDDRGRVKQFIDPMRLEGLRVAGETALQPYDVDKMTLNGATLAGRFEVCLDGAGAPESVRVVKSTGVVHYDASIVERITKTWRFKPVPHAGSLCANFGFEYSQHGNVRVDRS